jgi:hypothetical protein
VSAPPVAGDEALAAVARTHSQDMSDRGFFGHVSPTTGTPDDRLRGAHLLYAVRGENVALAASARDAHESLMQSPGHRELMLTPDFTHVGIGAVVRSDSAGSARVYVTMEFVREKPVPIEDVPTRILEATDMVRLPHFVRGLRLDGALTDAAKEAMAAIVATAGSADGTDSAAASRALDAAKTSAVRGQKPPRSTCAMLFKSVDPAHFTPPLVASDPRAERLGVAAVRDPQGPETFHVVFVIQGKANAALHCDELAPGGQGTPAR